MFWNLFSAGGFLLISWCYSSNWAAGELEIQSISRWKRREFYCMIWR
jgi:hypothetical protein